MNTTTLREYEVTGRYYDNNTTEADVGSVQESAHFSLQAAPSQGQTQFLDSPTDPLLRFGTEDTTGGYVVFLSQRADQFRDCLVDPPEESQEVVRKSVTGNGTFFDPWSSSPETLSNANNSQQSLPVYFQPIYSGHTVGLRIQLNGITPNTPYVDLTPAQYRDFAHAVGEYIRHRPGYRTAQQCEPTTVPASGTIDSEPLVPPYLISDDNRPRLIGLEDEPE